MSRSRSEYVCDLCELPLQKTARGFRHSVNARTKTRSCGLAPAPRRRDSVLLLPGMPVTIWRPAGSVTVNGRPLRQRMQPGSFDRQLGRVITLSQKGVPQGQMALRRAEVASDGYSVTLHYEVVEGAA